MNYCKDCKHKKFAMASLFQRFDVTGCKVRGVKEVHDPIYGLNYVYTPCHDLNANCDCKQFERKWSLV